MTNDQFASQLLAEDGDADVVTALRSFYSAPDGPFYWAQLERRIMERIARVTAFETWWSIPVQWVRVGVMAAGFALIVAGALVLRARAEERQMAYDSVLGPANGGPTLAIRDAQSEQQATLTYINGR